jgi:hypothetical protein
MDFLIVGRFRAMSTLSSGRAMCKTIAGLNFANDRVLSRIGSRSCRKLEPIDRRFRGFSLKSGGRPIAALLHDPYFRGCSLALAACLRRGLSAHRTWEIRWSRC